MLAARLGRLREISETYRIRKDTKREKQEASTKFGKTKKQEASKKPGRQHKEKPRRQQSPKGNTRGINKVRDKKQKEWRQQRPKEKQYEKGVVNKVRKKSNNNKKKQAHKHFETTSKSNNEHTAS